MTRAAKLVWLPLVLLMAAFFFYVSQHRLIDGDEGFYLLASRLVLQHRAPYLDFFYTQAPLLPYVYAAWLKLAGLTWISARVFCALLSTAVGALIYWHVCRETGKALAGAFAVLLFASSTLVFAWYPIVKTFALGMLFLFPAYMIFARLSSATRTWLICAAGALLGLSVDTRSYIVGVLPVFVWWLLRRKEEPGCPTHSRLSNEWERRGPHMLWFLGGFAVGVIPSLVLFLASPAAFLFNNLGYHALRSGGEGLIGNWHDKMMIVGATVGGAYTGFQFTVTALTALGLVIASRVRRVPSSLSTDGRVPQVSRFSKPGTDGSVSGGCGTDGLVNEGDLLALVLAVVLGFVSLLPTPASIQYFALVMPFLTVAAVCSASDYFDRQQSPQNRQMLRGAGALLIVVYLGFAVPILDNYMFTGKKVPGLRDARDAPNWTLGQVTAVSRAIDEIATPGEQVVSFWPGYLFASTADPVPGMENNFGMWVADSLTPEKRHEYHILSAQETAALLAQHKASIAVVGNQGPWNGAPEFERSVAQLRALGYRFIRNIGQSAIFEYGGAK
jgi:hypothetical protein